MPLFHRSSSKEREDKQPSPSSQHKTDEPSLFSRITHKHSHEATIAPPTPTSRPSSGVQSPASVTPQSTDSDRGQRHHHARSRSRERSSSETQSGTKGSAYPSLGDKEKHDARPSHLPEKVTDGLTRDDIKLLFSGAPYFMLEAGRRHRAFPQSYFPFTSPLEITDLQDRLYTQHESFTLSSLHAHLPVPFRIGKDETIEQALPQPELTGEMERGRSLNVSPQGVQQQSPKIEGGAPETTKRPMFDMSIYERPNMLFLHGVEPGTIGMRNFLEHAVADGLVTHGREEHGGKDSDIGSLSQEHEWEGADDEGEEKIDLEKLPGWEGYKSLGQDSGARIGKHAPRQDRAQLLKGDTQAWKNIAIRPITMKKIAARLEQVSSLRDTVVNKGWLYTILDEFGAAELGRDLFGEEAGLLFPPSSLARSDRGKDFRDLKVQIEILVKVLTTPGAWLDFSLPAERLLFAQDLYTKEVAREDVQGITPEQKRKWGLIQLVLAIELVVRLDAALRKGVATKSKELVVENAEIRKFNGLRNLKVDWDLVVARRWLDLCFAKKIDLRAITGPGKLDGVSLEQGREREEKEERQKGREKERRLLTKMKHSLSFRQEQQYDKTAPRPLPDDIDYDVAILPRQPLIMAQGLIRFATDISWPSHQISLIRESLFAKLHRASPKDREEMLSRNVEPLSHPHVPQHAMDKSTVELRAATQRTLGGPLSLAWLGGLVVPGYISCDVLMCTLLESDPEAIERLGVMAHVRSGFVLRGRSWWSKTCIVGTVMAAVQEAKERMGWIGLSEVVGPVDEELREIDDGWRLIDCEERPRLRKEEGERIFDGERLAKESSPLGVGKGGVRSAEFEMLIDRMLDELYLTKRRVEVAGVQLMLVKNQDKEKESEEYYASVAVQITDHTENGEKAQQLRIPLRYKVRFVGAHPCRPPYGHVHLQPHINTKIQTSNQLQTQGSNTPATETLEPTDDSNQLSRSETSTTEALLSPITTITSSVSTLASPISPTSDSKPVYPTHHHRVRKHEHLPAHPLHRSYSYTLKTLGEIIESLRSRKSERTRGHGDGDGHKEEEEDEDLPGVEAGTKGGVWIVDARASASADGAAANVLARAWCASIGRDAIVSRVGRGCLSCAVREARALEIGVVIRVG